MASIEAHITKVYGKRNRAGEATGWYVIETEPPLNPAPETKIKEKAQEARGLMESNALVLLDYNDSPGNPKPGGGFYVNRYYEKAGPIGERSNGGPEIPLGPAPDSDGDFQRRTNPVDAWRMTLAASAKLAVETLPLMPVEQRTFDTQKRIALAWAQWLIATPPPVNEDNDIPF